MTLEYNRKEDLARAVEVLSRADLYRSKIIKHQNYRFEKYFLELLAGISLVNEKVNNNYISYRPPDRIIMLGGTKEVRKNEKELYMQLAKDLHCSTRKIRNQMPLLNMIMPVSKRI